MKNFINFALVLCIFLVAAEAKYRNTGVRDQVVNQFRERNPLRQPTVDQQRVQNGVFMERLHNGGLNIRTENRNGEYEVQPIVNQQYIHRFGQHQHQPQNPHQNSANNPNNSK